MTTLAADSLLVLYFSSDDGVLVEVEFWFSCVFLGFFRFMAGRLDRGALAWLGWLLSGWNDELLDLMVPLISVDR